MRTLLNILAIAVKDFLDSVKNRTVFFAILFPVLLSLIFRIVLESGSMPLLNLALVNGQGTKLAGYVTKFGLGKIHVEMVEDADLAKKMVADGKVHAALVLPDGFEEKMAKGRTPPWPTSGWTAQTLPGGRPWRCSSTRSFTITTASHPRRSWW